MTLIEEIQQEAVDSKGNLGTVLRKCKILAARLGSRPLENWLLWESNGYPEEVEVPDYRIWSTRLKGHFVGGFGSGLRNAPIPWGCIPEKVRKDYMNFKFRQSIASIEDILRRNKGETLEVSTGDLAVILGMKVYQGQNCMQAWGEFSVGHLVELLNSVRNKVLDFALAIWKESPMAGELSNERGQSISPARTSQIFNTVVYGEIANLVGSAVNSPVEISVVQRGDLSALAKALQSIGVEEKDIQDLKTAVKADEPPKLPGVFGPSVSKWIAGMIQKAAQGTWQIGIGAAGKLLAEAIAKYYGL